MQPRTGRQVVKAGLAVSVFALTVYGCVGVSPASSLTAAVSSGASIAADESGPLQSGPRQSGPEVTVGPSKTKKPKHTRPPTTTTTDAPTTAPTDTAPATDVPTDAPTDAPTDVPTPAGSGGGIHLRSLPINLASFVIQPIDQKLDYTAAASYGEANLSTGFVPDPYSIGMTTGGPVDVSYLGSSCTGFATTAPDVRINFGGGGASLLRIYFVGANADPSMVVNDPYGNFYCVDDSFGTVNPTIDFNNPAGGSYDVWIAAPAGGSTISGTLYVTGNSGNHP
jgi:hypothetical protein